MLNVQRPAGSDHQRPLRRPEESRARPPRLTSVAKLTPVPTFKSTPWILMLLKLTPTGFLGSAGRRSAPAVFTAVRMLPMLKKVAIVPDRDWRTLARHGEEKESQQEDRRHGTITEAGQHEGRQG